MARSSRDFFEVELARMTVSSGRTVIGSPYSSTDIEEGETNHSSEDGRGLAGWIAKIINVGSQQGTNFDKILGISSGGQSLEEKFLNENFRKFATRSNLDLADLVFLYKAANADEPRFDKKDTWVECFEWLRDALERNSATTFELCVISLDTTNLSRTFSSFHKILITSHDRLQRIYSVPSEIAIQLVQSKWELCEEIKTKITESIRPNELSLPAWEPNLPSQQTGATAESHSQAPLRFTFKWIDCPHYTTDLSVYVFRPHGNHPQVKSLEVILTSTQYEQMRRTIVIVNSQSMLTQLRGDGFPTRVPEHNVSGLSYTLNLFRVICGKITFELTKFTKQACEEINFMIYEGRLRPSGSKIQYLQHLEECHHVAMNCCRDNRQTLQVLLDRVDLIETQAEDERNLMNELEMVTNDLDYLLGEITSSSERIQAVRDNIREHLDLLQIRRTRTLGVLAALYLPLSFVTSFLGMNISQWETPPPFWHNVTVFDPTKSTNPHKFTNPTNSTHQTNFTTFHHKIRDSGANHAWSLQDFFEIAVPLMVGTIVMPLIIGAVIRVLLQALAQGRIWGRFLLAFLVFGYSIASAVSTVNVNWRTTWLIFLPFWLLITLNLVLYFRSEKKNWLRLVYWLAGAGWLTMILLIPFWVPGPYFEYGSGKEFRMQASRWLLYSRITAGIMGATYGVSLFVVWGLRPDFYYRWDQRRPKPKQN